MTYIHKKSSKFIIFSKDAINWSHITVKIFTIMLERFISNKYCYFKLTYHRLLIITVSTKILSSTTDFNVDNINNKKYFLSQHIRIISEGSCDTEDWSNDAENSALPSQK